MIRCDGTRWIPSREEPGRWEPCPTCNTYLADQFRDPSRWKRYLHGTRVPEPGKVAPDLRAPDMPCPMHHEQTPDHAHGAPLAVSAYIAECSRLGREPRDETIAAIMGGVL